MINQTRCTIGILVGYCHPHSLAYKILYRGTVYNTGHVYFNEDLSSTKPDDSLVRDIKIFFGHLQAPNNVDLVDEEINQLLKSNDTVAEESPANDPSNRKIEDIIIDEPFVPVSTRTRKKTSATLPSDPSDHHSLSAISDHTLQQAILSNAIFMTLHMM
jgi:hypothetical protein